MRTEDMQALIDTEVCRSLIVENAPELAYVYKYTSPYLINKAMCQVKPVFISETLTEGINRITSENDLHNLYKAGWRLIAYSQISKGMELNMTEALAFISGVENKLKEWITSWS